MLDVLTDFWRPAAKAAQKIATNEKTLTLADLKLGGAVGFGFMPQALLSGRRLSVETVSTYQFGEEKLISYGFTPSADTYVSMIVAQTEGEQYLALSRKIPEMDRASLCDPQELANAIAKPEVKKLRWLDHAEPYKGWVVSHYSKQIHGLRGKISEGDARSEGLRRTREFEYFLFVSDSNEYAIEVEKYADGKVEVFATVYRRTSDIGQVSAPNAAADASTEKGASPASPLKSPVKEVISSAPVLSSSAAPAAKEEAKKPDIKSDTKTDITAEKLKQAAEASKSSATPVQPSFPLSSTHNQPTENVAMSFNEPLKSDIRNVSQREASNRNEILEPNEEVQCDLSVANRVIEEAIRTEMRLSDVVRHIIELPVAHQEAVQLPIILSDEDYKVLGARYGINVADREAIKRRIAKDLADFAGKKVA